MDLRALRYFLAVAEELHFTRAAERMHVAQSALSGQIRRLEDELGVELLRRTTRTVELSAAGERFLPRARRIIEEADAALADASRAARGEAGEIRIDAGATAGLDLVPRLLGALAEARPDLGVRLGETDCRDFLADLRSGELDAALVWLPVALKDLGSVTLHEESRVAALPAGHPLASRPDLEIGRLLDQPWAWVDGDPVAVASWTFEAERGGVARRGATVRSMAGMLEAVRAGFCVASLPRSQAEALDPGGVVLRPIPGAPPATLALLWLEASTTPALPALLEVAGRVASIVPHD